MRVTPDGTRGMMYVYKVEVQKVHKGSVSQIRNNKWTLRS